MTRTCVVTGSASGIGAATARHLRAQGVRVIGCDLHEAEVIADLATAAGREALVEGVRQLSDGHIDAIVANAGGGPPQTMLALNFFGAMATLQGLRPLLAKSAAPRAVGVSSIASLQPGNETLVEACLALNEAAATAVGEASLKGAAKGEEVQAALRLYGAAKQALQLWCRRAAGRPDWAGAGISLNVVAFGFFDTPAAAYILTNPDARRDVARLAPLRGAFPGSPDEAAAALSWCVSPENSQMTGQLLFVDAGIEALARGRDQ